MTVVSSREFAANQRKYFDMAENENICIKRGKSRFHLVYQFDEMYADTSEYDKVLEPDEDFYRAISMDELCRRVKQDIHQWYKERDESNCIAGSTAVS